MQKSRLGNIDLNKLVITNILILTIRPIAPNCFLFNELTKNRIESTPKLSKI